MMTLLAALIGFAGSFLPDLLKFLRQREDNKQELAVLNLQIKRDKLQGEQRIREIEVEADAREVEAIHAEFKDRKPTYAWVEAYIQSVRPTITYAFFGMYSVVKFAQLKLAIFALGDGQETIFRAIAAVWHENDAALLTAIVCFWFGQRAMKHVRKGN